MFMVNEADAAAIRTAFEQGGHDKSSSQVSGISEHKGNDVPAHVQ